MDARYQRAGIAGGVQRGEARSLTAAGSMTNNSNPVRFTQPSSVSPIPSRRSGKILTQVGAAIRGLVNPVNLFAGAKLNDVLMADNIVVFKRTQTRMLRPQGVTHNYHHRFELVIPLARSGRIHVDDKAYMLKPGQAYLIFPHQFHHFLDLEAGDMNWLFITFECERAHQLLPLRNSPRIFGPDECDALLTAMNSYRGKEPVAERNYGLIMNVSRLLRALLKSRVADCAVNTGGSERDSHGAILQPINAYVRANLNKHLTIGDLAKHTGYSVSYLRAVFRKEFGASLGSYMRESRLSVAASMLSDPKNKRIEAIAKACGFSSIWAFSRAFKMAMGRSPRAYQRFLENAEAPESASAQV